MIMGKMEFTILKYENCSKKIFINFWSKYYNDIYASTLEREGYYDNNIKKEKYTENDIKELYLWKNNGKLSNLKEGAVEDYLKNIEYINKSKQSKKAFDKEEFKNKFGDLSIWRIFLLHIMKPNEFPVFDQHVYRAYYFIKNREIKEIPTSAKDFEKVYYFEYIPFFNELLIANTLEEIRTVDKALWAFGKNIKRKINK